ncbi:RING/U-box superfamily protein [Striga asiatica]|uniref:RING-type E3 ubiquitin transferase n=1 Tax=Striga asiatica TaxID=4170 RepID=A0A5A7P8Q5_STRAF|nr:RING/U-box superfamily protein [Striga asiatica]
MGHQNTRFTGHMIDMQTEQQGHPNPEPCIFYGNSPSFPQPNIHPHRMYGMPQPSPNLDLAMVTPSGLYNNNNNNPYFVPPQSGNFIAQTNHGIVGVDCVGGPFKGKIAGPSSSAAGGPSSESEPSSMLQGGFVVPPGGLPWVDMHFRANNGDFGGAFRWARAPVPYVNALEISAGNRSSGGFLPPHFAQGHLNPHHPPPPAQVMRGYNNNFNLPSQVSVTPTHRISTFNASSNTSTTRFQNVPDVRPAFVTPFPPMGFHNMYQPQQRELMLDSNVRPHTFPQLRVLPEDEVAILEMPGYHEAGDSIDHHRDMRLDIDHMSYEELLALGEQIGSVGTGLPNEFVRKNLKTRSFITSSAACPNLRDETDPDEQINFCVICQTEYEPGEKIGTVECGHEYHKDCINKWLLIKNTCPICKSTALGRKSKAS